MINFMKYRYFYFLLSALFIVPGLISLLLFGFRPSIDFTGGSFFEIHVVQNQKHVDMTEENLQHIVGPQYQLSAVQSAGSDEFILHGKPLTNDQKILVMASLQNGIGKVQEQRFETVGPTLGAELLQK